MAIFAVTKCVDFSLESVHKHINVYIMYFTRNGKTKLIVLIYYEYIK